MTLIFSLASTAWAKLPTEGPAAGVGIEQRLGEQLPLDIPLIDEAGRDVHLGDYFNRKKPIVVVLAYYQCPMLCTQVLNGLLKSSQAIPWELDKDYEIVTVSFNPSDTPQMAAAKKQNYIKLYARPGAEAGWHFLTAKQPAIDELTAAVGFHYRYDEPSGQFAHASGIMVATPEGKLSRYFYKIEYPPTDLRLALLESSQDRIGSLADQVLMLCFHYDPATGRYGWAIATLLRSAALLTVGLLGGFILVNLRRERRQRRRLLPLSLGEGRSEGSGNCKLTIENCKLQIDEPLDSRSSNMGER